MNNMKVENIKYMFFMAFSYQHNEHIKQWKSDDRMNGASKWVC